MKIFGKRIRKRFIFTILAILLVAGLVWQFVFNKKSTIEYTTVKAERGQLKQTVSETGTIKPISELELNFLNPGKIAVIPAVVGAKVLQDDVLAKLNTTDLSIKSRQASADLIVMQAKLDKLIAGASREDIALAEANYQAALDDLDKTTQSTTEAVDQAQTTYNNLTDQNATTKSSYRQSVENKTDALLTSLDNKIILGVAALDAIKRITDDSDIKYYLSIRNEKYLVDTKNTYATAATALDLAQTKQPIDSNDKAGLTNYYNSTISALNLVFKDLNYCFNALEYSITASDFSQTTLDTHKATISGQSTTISTAIGSLQTSKQSLDDATVALANAIVDAKNALDTAKTNKNKLVAAAQSRVNTVQAQLRQITAKSRVEDISLARAQVQQAQASLDLISNQVANDTIKAPIAGVITQVNYKVGEQSTGAKPVIVMIAENNYEIEIDVSETDISKVKLSDPAVVTLDAYGDSVKFEGRVMFIEPAETLIQGVTYYKVKIDFSPDELHPIKPGMTATAEISTAIRDNVLMIPMRAVLDKDGNKYVRILNGTQVLESLVKLGLSGDGGLVEVISGVNEGDNIITFTKDTAKK
jgi:RND family efflux transporter MFP subunit